MTSPALPDLAALLAAVAERHDFAFSADLGRVAWVNDEAVEWVDDATPGLLGRVEPGGALPSATHVELVAAGLIGLCRPTAAGVELLAVDLDATGTEGVLRPVADLAAPRTCLVPRLPGAEWQYLAADDFAGGAVMWRVDWPAGTLTEAGRLPGSISGAVWLDAAGDRLAVNLMGESGRSSAHILDFEAHRYHRLFEVSPDSEDRAVLFDPATDLLVVTTDAFGYAAVGVTRLEQGPLRFFPALSDGEEAAEPCAFLSGGGGLILRHESGVVSRLHIADVATLEIGPPLAIPEGEVGGPVVVDGHRLRFPFSAPDLPWRPASYDLAGGGFQLDELPAAARSADRPGHRAHVPARVTSFPTEAGAMPTLVYPPVPTGTLARTGLAVVALHGGPIARWAAEFLPELQLFTQLGLPTIALNYPGSTGSGQEFMRSLFGRAGSLDVEAVASVVDGLAAEGHRVVLYGESYGAFLALATATVRPCAGVAAYAPFASFESLRRTGSPEVRDLLELLDGGNPVDYGRNLLTARRNIRCKVLIAHGTADIRIPAAESRALVQVLRGRDGAGEHDVRFVELDGQGHELSGRPVLEHWYREVASFVAGLSESRSPAQRIPAAGALSRRPRNDQPERR